MNIDINVRNRQISTQASCLIPAGSRNDAFMKFIFDPGYGWEGLEITAVFTRTDMTAYRTHIQPDMYTPIPTNILANPGVFFVSLIGCKGDDTIATTQTLGFTVENNAMDILRPTPYPVKDDNTYDSDAYAQYVSLVTDALNRAEAAAKYLEENAAGYYSKSESDDRYMKRFTLTTMVEKGMDMSNVVAGDIPKITFTAYEVDLPCGTLSDPAFFHPIDAVRINLRDCKGAESNFGYTGFNMYRLGNLCDELNIDKHGAVLTKRVHSVMIGDLDGCWQNDTTYVASMVTVPPIDMANRDLIRTNVGNIISSVQNDRLELTFPEHIPSDTLANIEVVYPLEKEYTKLISYVPGPTVTADLYLRIFYVKNQTQYLANLFSVTAEFDLQKYLNKLSDGHTELAISNMQAQVCAVNERVNQVADIKIFIGPRYNTNKEFWKVKSGYLGLQINALVAPVSTFCEVLDGVQMPIQYASFETTETTCTFWFPEDTIKAVGDVTVIAMIVG